MGPKASLELFPQVSDQLHILSLQSNINAGRLTIPSTSICVVRVPTFVSLLEENA